MDSEAQESERENMKDSMRVWVGDERKSPWSCGVSMRRDGLVKSMVESSGGAGSGGVGWGGRGLSEGRDGRLRGVRRGSLAERSGIFCSGEHASIGCEESVVAEGMLRR